MATEIKIFDHRDKPFGCLSNNYSNYVQGYKQSIPVIQKLNFGDGKPCNTLTNYIYASLLKDESRKKLVCAANPKEAKTKFDPKEAKTKFDKHSKEEKAEKIRQSVKEALKAMFDQNPDLAELLLSTGNRKLIYISKTGNKFFGKNEDGNGDNWYGVLLEQERNRLLVESGKQKKQKDKENEEKNMYDTYLAQKALTDAINKEGNDLKNYIGLSSEQILQKFDRGTLANGLLSRKDFLNSFPNKLSRSVLSYVQNPENMVHLIRKEFLPTLKDKKLREKKKQIFIMYADYLLEKKGVNREDYEKAKVQQFSGEKFNNQANELEDRLYDLYNKGMLSERLSTDIDKRFKGYSIPTDQEIAETKKYDESSVKKAVLKQESRHVSSNTNPIYILSSDAVEDKRYKENADYVYFSPDNVIKHKITINGLTYLTVNHYIIEKLMLQLGVKSVRSYIIDPVKKIFRNLPDIIKDYKKFKTEYYKKNLILYAKKGLDMKFSNRVMQDYLLATGNAKLVYNDRYDSILGTGNDFKGDNEVGKYLMELRTKLVQKRGNEEEEFKLLTTGDITWILNNNFFMKDWVIQRVKDSCRTIITVNDYVKEKFDTKDIISVNFVKAVLDNIYHPCSQIYGAVDQIEALLPEYFENIVKNCVGMESASPEIIDVLWKRIAVIIYYLIIHLKDAGAKIQDISSQIGHVQVLKSQTIKCESIVSDEYENCIIVALVNLIIGIVYFNIKNSKTQINVTNVEVQTAASIILESIIPKKLTKPKENEEVVVEDLTYSKDEEEVVEVPTYDPSVYLDELIELNEIDANKEGKLTFIPSDSEESENDECDKEEFDYSEGEGEEESYSPSDKILPIVEYLKQFQEIETDDVEKLATYIEEAVTIIKHKSKLIPEQIKRNRVNFFAGHK